jgi:hypothetical protein
VLRDGHPLEHHEPGTPTPELDRLAVVDFPGFDPAIDRRMFTVALKTSTTFVLGSSIAPLLAGRAAHTMLGVRTITVSAFTEESLESSCSRRCPVSPSPPRPGGCSRTTCSTTTRCPA